MLKAHPILTELSAAEQAQLRTLAEEFLGSMQFRWGSGVERNEKTRAAVAVLACLPILNLGLRWYRRWRTVLLVEHDYDTDFFEVDEAGVVHEGVDLASGEFGTLGSVVLSLADVAQSGKGSGFNVVVHEAAHVLDCADGSFDGAPPLHKEMDRTRWAEVFTAAYEDLQRRVAGAPRAETHRRTAAPGYGSKRRRRSIFDPYAAEAPEEFFAVASELFFERPRRLQAEYPAVYRELALFYRQDRVS